MDVMLLRLFQEHVLLQCEFIIFAAEDLNVALKQGDDERVFNAIQSLLSSQANISKALWGEGRRKVKERERLRSSIGVDDSSPFHTTDMRDNYDHYDERLERWWRDSKRHIYIGLCIGPLSAIGGVELKDRFRSYDPATKKAYFWDQESDIQALLKEVMRVLPTLREEAAKPHWE